MKEKIVLLMFMFFLAVLCINLSESAYDMTKGSDWKWSYALIHPNESLSNIWITNADIEYAEMQVKASKEDCEQMGGVWCGWHADDNATLQRMLNAKSLQPTNPPADATKSIWQKFMDFMKKIFGEN
jgi:hypothetical protein